MVMVSFVWNADAKLVAYFNFDQSGFKAGEGVQDLGSIPYVTATLMGGAITGADPFGREGKAASGVLDLRGEKSLKGIGYVHCGSSPKFDFTSSMTISVWIKTSYAGYWGAIVSRQNAWLLDVPGQVRWQITSVGEVYSTTNVNDCRWHQVTGVFNRSAGKMFLYVDGVMENSANTSAALPTGNGSIQIGANGGDHIYQGLLDEVGIWDVALNSQDVWGVYENGVAGHLVAHYGFDQVGNTTVMDSSGWGSSADGVLVGDAQTIMMDDRTVLSLAGGYVDLGRAAKTALTGSLTVACWMKTVAPGYWGTLVGRGNPDDVYDASWHMMIPDGIRWQMPYRGEVFSKNFDPADNRWHHIACTRDSVMGEQKIYTDGAPNQTTLGNTTDLLDHPGYITTLGSLAGFHPYYGFIDDVRIYDSALSDGLVRQLVHPDSGQNSIRMPEVSVGPDQTAWLMGGSATLPLQGQVTYADSYQAQWSVLSQPENSVVRFENPGDEGTRVTLSVPGDYTLQLQAISASQVGSDTLMISIFENACEHSQNTRCSTWTPLRWDLNHDCVVELNDFGQFSAEWMSRYTLGNLADYASQWLECNRSDCSW
jgi:hypothetical protein